MEDLTIPHMFLFTPEQVDLEDIWRVADQYAMLVQRSEEDTLSVHERVILALCGERLDASV